MMETSLEEVRRRYEERGQRAEGREWREAEASKNEVWRREEEERRGEKMRGDETRRDETRREESRGDETRNLFKIPLNLTVDKYRHPPILTVCEGIFQEGCLARSQKAA
jgi:hypothetical protein